MNSLNWKSPKNAVKDRQEYTPNIYRKPSVDDEPEQKTQSDDSSPEIYKSNFKSKSKSQPLTYKSANVESEQLYDKSKTGTCRISGKARCS